MRRVAPFFTLGGLCVALLLVVGLFWMGAVPQVRADAPAPAGLLTATPTASPGTPSGTPDTPTLTPTPTRTPTATATACFIYFVDVPPDNAFYASVRCLSCRGIVGGYPCGGPGEPCPGAYYRPGNQVTRGQTSKIIALAAGFTEPVPSAQQTFEDVPPADTFWGYVERLAGRGIIGGYPCGGAGEPCVAPGNRPYFRPNANVTRGQLAKIVSGAAGYTTTPTGQTFADVPPGHPFYLYVERIAARGIISGYPCGGPGEPCPGTYYRPNNPATRGQMAKIAANTFFPACDTPGPTPTPTRTPANTPIAGPTSTPCAPDWTTVPSPNLGAGSPGLESVAAVSTNNVWAVGNYNNNTMPIEQTLVGHWDGTNWSMITSPNPGTYNNFLHSVAVVSASDIWAVGFYSDGDYYHTLAEHWNGSDWSVVPSPNGGTDFNELQDVVVVGPGDIWAVGSYGDTPSGTLRTLVEHWNGTSWSIVPSPNGLGDLNELRSVAAVGPGNIWAVGYSDDANGKTLVEHWDGSNWSIVPSPNVGTMGSSLDDVAAVSTNNIWAVGTYLNANIVSQTLIEHWDGTSWSIIPSPNAGMGYNIFQGIAAASATDAWAVGYYSPDPITPDQALVEHWNGTSWQIVPIPTPGSGYSYLQGVTMVSTNDVWAVGSYSTSSTTDEALTEHYAPTCP